MNRYSSWLCISHRFLFQWFSQWLQLYLRHPEKSLKTYICLLFTLLGPRAFLKQLRALTATGFSPERKFEQFTTTGEIALFFFLSKDETKDERVDFSNQCFSEDPRLRNRSMTWKIDSFSTREWLLKREWRKSIGDGNMFTMRWIESQGKKIKIKYLAIHQIQ